MKTNEEIKILHKNKHGRVEAVRPSPRSRWWHLRVKGRNGQVLVASETFPRLRGPQRNFAALRKVFWFGKCR